MAACGLKGPLYLPQDEPNTRQPAEAAAEDAEDAEDADIDTKDKKKDT